jgi:HSP20 family molecular chaperone IbpA
VHSPSRPAQDHRARHGWHAVRDVSPGDAPEWSAIPTQRPSHRLSLEASLGQTRLVTLDDYKLRWTRTDLTVVADLPGVKASEISLAVDPGQVTISSVIQRGSDGGGGALWQLCRDMRPGRCNKTLTIPEGLLVDRWTATFEDGVLRLRIPRAGRR